MAGEARLEGKFKKAVKAAGGRSYKFVSPANRGVSDQIVQCPGGIVVFTELKDGKKPMSPLQEIFERDTLAMGCNHEVIRYEEGIQKFINKYF